MAVLAHDDISNNSYIEWKFYGEFQNITCYVQLNVLADCDEVVCMIWVKLCYLRNFMVRAWWKLILDFELNPLLLIERGCFSKSTFRCTLLTCDFKNKGQHWFLSMQQSRLSCYFDLLKIGAATLRFRETYVLLYFLRFCRPNVKCCIWIALLFSYAFTLEWFC